MKRVLLLAALAALSLVMTNASAGGTAECGADLSVHNAAQCTSATTLVANETTPTLAIEVSIGPAADLFNGDVRAVLTGETSGALIHRSCVYRATNGFGALDDVCLDYTEGTFVPGENLVCSGTGSGIGAWKVKCSN